MKITNKYNLPEIFVNAVRNDSHVSLNYSASQMRKSARMVWLEKRHYDELEEDAIDCVWRLFGTGCHAILEKGEDEHAITEGYFKHFFGDIGVSCFIDVYRKKKIQDWKVTSAWSYVFLDDEKMKDFESQLNVDAYLATVSGFDVEELEIVMILRDWKKNELLRSKGGYPPRNVITIPIKLWTLEQQEKYIRDRIAYYESFKDVQDNELPFCTPVERWAKPSKWAVMKEGRKTAIKVCDTKEIAVQYISDTGLDAKHYLEERPEEQWKRCEYCAASVVCNQYQDAHASESGNEEKTA